MLYPDDHIFRTQGYEIQQNINFTGLEIDLLAKHTIRNETLIIECKAKEKPKSTELKNFAFNVSDKEVNFGYFVYTEELDHQAAGLKEEWEKKEKYKNLTFFGPDKIIKSLINSGKIKNIDLYEIESKETLYKKILVYTYFGIFYIIIPFKGSKTSIFYLFDATTGTQIKDTKKIANDSFSKTLTIDGFKIRN